MEKGPFDGQFGSTMLYIAQDPEGRRVKFRVPTNKYPINVGETYVVRARPQSHDPNDPYEKGPVTMLTGVMNVTKAGVSADEAMNEKLINYVMTKVRFNNPEEISNDVIKDLAGYNVEQLNAIKNNLINEKYKYSRLNWDYARIIDNLIYGKQKLKDKRPGKASIPDTIPALDQEIILNKFLEDHEELKKAIENVQMYLPQSITGKARSKSFLKDQLIKPLATVQNEYDEVFRELNTPGISHTKKQELQTLSVVLRDVIRVKEQNIKFYGQDDTEIKSAFNLSTIKIATKNWYKLAQKELNK
jgi:hypothetical protein